MGREGLGWQGHNMEVCFILPLPLDLHEIWASALETTGPHREQWKAGVGQRGNHLSASAHGIPVHQGDVSAQDHRIPRSCDSVIHEPFAPS